MSCQEQQEFACLFNAGETISSYVPIPGGKRHELAKMDRAEPTQLFRIAQDRQGLWFGLCDKLETIDFR